MSFGSYRDLYILLCDLVTSAFVTMGLYGGTAKCAELLISNGNLENIWEPGWYNAGKDAGNGKGLVRWYLYKLELELMSSLLLAEAENGFGVFNPNASSKLLRIIPSFFLTRSVLLFAEGIREDFIVGVNKEDTGKLTGPLPDG